MFKYPETTEKSTSAPEHPVRRVSGRSLAHAHLNRRQRAKLAAALVDGSAEIFPPTVKQAAMLADVPVVAVTQVRRTNGNGHADANANASGSGPDQPGYYDETLAQHILRSSLAERIEAVRVVGVDVVWDTMVSPVVATERTAAE
jgi:hypothetical protein